MRNAFLYIFSIFFLFSCKDSFNYVSRKGTIQEKYEYATKYYNKKKYSKAQPLLDEIYPLYKGKKEAENIYYMVAYSHYNLKDYLLASYHFENFTQQYSLSPKVEECWFMHCMSEFYKSQPFYLDQTITENGIKQFQIFVNNYPDTRYMSQCNEYIDKLRAKLHKKAYENAKLYYRMGDYKASTVAFKNAVEDYPDLPQKDEFEFLIVKANYLYAKNSILQLQGERYKKALDASVEFMKEHAQTPTIYNMDVVEIQDMIKVGLAKSEKEMKKKQPAPANSATSF